MTCAATGAALVELALAHLGERYVFGARVPKRDPHWKGPWDCAELASWAVYQVAGVLYGVNGTDPATADAYSGRWADDARRRGRAISLAEAYGTAGAVLVREPRTIGGHVAFSDGLGRTVEAHSARLGVIRGVARGRRWDLGVLVPEISYERHRAPLDPMPLGRILREGSKGPEVRAAQHALVAQGFSVAGDGIFGARTAEAVVAFQRARPLLVVDGEIGPETWRELGLAPHEPP